jgi:glycosyltransferase involved in cell wall biosynthesis
LQHLRILVYGDIDINIIDGSSIWLTSIIKVLSVNDNIQIDYLLKTPVRNRELISSIENIKNLKIINPYEDGTFTTSKLQVGEAYEYINKLDNISNYDCILSRGFSICEYLARDENLKDKLITYITDFNHDKDNIDQEEVSKLRNVYDGCRYMCAQTPEAKEVLKEIIDINIDDKFIVLSPMIPDFEEKEPRFINENNSLVYSGKFAKDWYTYEILNAFIKLQSHDNNIKLNFVGSKFQKDIEDKKQEIIDILEKNKKINWSRGVSREESNKLIEKSDIGIAWRSPLIDNDNSVELSTKVLE